MIAFNISRRILNVGLALVHPRWRLIALMAVLGIVNVIVGQLNLLTIRSNIAGLTPQEYLQYPHSDYWGLVCSVFWVGLIPLLIVVLPNSLLNFRRPQLDKQVDQTLRSLGLKGQVYSAAIMLYQGTINGRQITIFADARRPTRGVYVTPQPKTITLNPGIQIRISAAHRGDMSLLPETTQITRLPPGISKTLLNRGVLPGMTLLTLDEEWSANLLANEKVTTAIRQLAPESNPNRHYTVVIAGLSVTLKIVFVGWQQTTDPLAHFVTSENMQQILADLRVVAEAAESLPRPSKPGPDDNLARIASADPAALNQLWTLVVLVIFSAGWLCMNSSALLWR